MSQRDPRVDAYIAKAAPFARPILEHVRAVVHAACPACEETLKWGMPSFMYGSGILCGMAAFKAHASFGFWKHAAVVGEGGGAAPDERVGMGSFGKLASVRDLPPRRQLVAYVKKAMALNQPGAKAAKGPKSAPARKAAAPRPAPVPTVEFAAALRRNKAAAASFKAFPPGQQRDYVDWIAEAKREDTRDRRIARAIEWLAEGKPRNWKYM